MCGDTSVRANFGDLLRRARREAGLTQEELAESAGLSARGISDIERGIHRVPRRDTLKLLAHALQRPITDLENWRTSTRHNTQRLEDPATGAFPAPDLIGRDGEFQRLRDSIDRARSGRGRVTLLAGEPGVGKTRLATDVAGYAETQGMLVVWGLSHEEEGAPAYWPWIQILRGVTEPLSAEQMEADLGRGAGVIAQILPEVTDTLADVRDSESTASNQSQFELYDAVTGVIRNVSARTPLLVVLDDIHWSDRSSLGLLQFLARQIQTSQVALLGIYRDTELELYPDLVRTVAEVSRNVHTEQLALTGLSEHELSRLIAHELTRSPDHELLAVIHSRTEGNPFFASELARLVHLAERAGDIRSVDSVLTAVPPGVKGVLEQRFRRLAPDCFKTLAIASVAGREFGLAMLEALVSVPRETLLAVLDEAIRARLIERAGESVGRYRFSHALIRQALYDSLGSTERASLHRSAGEFLEHAHTGELSNHRSTLAHHFFEAIPVSDADRAIEYSIKAGDQAASQYAHAEAASHYQRALEALDMGAVYDSRFRCEVLLKLGDAITQEGRYRDAQAVFMRVAEISRSMDLPEHLVRSAIGAAGLGVIEHGEDQHLRLLQDAVAVCPKD